MKTSKDSIILVILSTILVSAAQIFYKFAVNQGILPPELFTNYNLIIGLFLYGIALLVLLFSLKKGELSVLYPIYSLSYIWVLFLSYFFFNEPITTLKIAGVFLVFSGVSVLGGG